MLSKCPKAFATVYEGEGWIMEVVTNGMRKPTGITFIKAIDDKCNYGLVFGEVGCRLMDHHMDASNRHDFYDIGKVISDVMEDNINIYEHGYRYTERVRIGDLEYKARFPCDDFDNAHIRDTILHAIHPEQLDLLP